MTCFMPKGRLLLQVCLFKHIKHVNHSIAIVCTYRFFSKILILNDVKSNKKI